MSMVISVSALSKSATISGKALNPFLLILNPK